MSALAVTLPVLALARVTTTGNPSPARAARSSSIAIGKQLQQEPTCSRKSTT
jgi:hypothetical protein